MTKRRHESLSPKHAARLEHCFHACAERAWRLANALLRDPHEAYDAVQQAFVVATRKADQIPAIGPWPWFSVVVAHEARNLRRKRKAMTNSLDGSPSTGTNDDQHVAAREIMDRRATEPLQQIATQEEHEALLRALDDLPEAEREAILLTRIGGMTHRAAAQALAMPRQTLTSHVNRGTEKLRETLGLPKASLKRSMIGLPLAAPPGGWDAALGAWKAGAGFTLGSSTTGALASTTLGGILMAGKSTILAAGLALGMGLGAAGGYLMHDEVTPAPLAQEADDQKSDQPRDGDLTEQARQAKLALADANDQIDQLKRKIADQAATADADAGAATAASDRNSDQASDQLRHQLADVTRERDALRAEVAELKRKIEPYLDEIDRRAPSFTFAEGEVLKAVKQANWTQMARATTASSQAIHNIVKAVRAGNQPDRADQLALQENTEKRRKYEFRVIGKIPSAARHNGENTAPITVSNVFAAMLADANLPLTETQIEQIQELGERFNEAAQRRVDGYPEGTLRAKRLLDEMQARAAFEDDLTATLTPKQREVVINPETHRIATLDLNGPTLMLVNSSPILTGTTPEEIRGKLEAYLRNVFELDDAQCTTIAPLLDAWISDCSAALERVPPVGYARSYTYDQAVIAGRATVELLTDVRRLLELDEATDQAIQGYADFFIPRLYDESQ